MDQVDQGFAPLFAACEARSQQADYSRFRDDPAFRFMVPVGSQRIGPDYEALGRAAALNADACARYMKRPKSTLGYGNERDYQNWDAVDCRHIMMSTFIFATRAWPPGIRVVE